MPLGEQHARGRRHSRLFSAGTIVSCPAEGCGVGLYKLPGPATFAALVVFDDQHLRPRNDTIPPPDVWRSLACPVCGARVLKDGEIHTLQYGWV
jgi:hypothetical protein